MTVRRVTVAAVSSTTTTPAASEDQPPCMQPIIHFKEMLIQQARLPHSTLDTTTETWQELITRAAATHQLHWADSPEHLQPSIITPVQHWGEHPDTGAETHLTTTLLRSILATPVRLNSTFLRDMEEKSRELNHLFKNFSILVIKKYLNHLLKNKVFIKTSLYSWLSEKEQYVIMEFFQVDWLTWLISIVDLSLVSVATFSSYDDHSWFENTLIHSCQTRLLSSL